MWSLRTAAKGVNAFSQGSQLEANYEAFDYQYFQLFEVFAGSRRGQLWGQLLDVATIRLFLINLVRGPFGSRLGSGL